jgi:hypothetical protein
MANPNPLFIKSGLFSVVPIRCIIIDGIERPKKIENKTTKNIPVYGRISIVNNPINKIIGIIIKLVNIMLI